MKILLLALIIIVLFSLLYHPFLIRSCARSRADQIIHGKRPAAEKQINRCIRVLTWTNEWITNQEEPDKRRIDRLRVKLYEMQHPHG